MEKKEKISDIIKKNKVKEPKEKRSSIIIKNSMKEKVEELESFSVRPSKKAIALAGVVAAGALPLGIVDAAYGMTTSIAGGIIKFAGNILAAPTELIAVGAYIAGDNCENRFSELLFKGVAAIVAVPGAIINGVAAITSGILKLSSEVVTMASYAINTPFRVGSYAILKRSCQKNSEKEKNNKNDIIEVEVEQC